MDGGALSVPGSISLAGLPRPDLISDLEGGTPGGGGGVFQNDVDMICDVRWKEPELFQGPTLKRLKSYMYMYM